MDKSNLEYLYRKTVERIFSSSENYLRFLDFSSNLYKYSLEDQIVIHGQSPFAKVVASFAQWKGLGRSVNKGSIGITRFNADTYRGTSADLFDVSDTNGADHTFPNLWRFPPEINITDFFGMDIDEYIKIFISERLSQLTDDTFTRTAQLLELCEYSTCYTILKRISSSDTTMALNVERVFSKINISSLDLLCKIDLLASITDSSQSILKETERSVKNESQQLYTAEPKQPTSTPNYPEERANLHTEPRNTDISSVNRGPSNGEIRREGGSFSDNPVPQSLSISNWRAEIGGAVDGGRQSVLPEGRSLDRELKGAENGAKQFPRQNEMARADEQESGGDLPTGTLLGTHITDEDELTRIKHDIAKSTFLDWDLYSQKSNGISAFFNAEDKIEKRIEYLQSVFGTAQDTWGFDSRLTQVNTDNEGLTIKLAQTSELPIVEHHFDWNYVEVLISELSEISHRPLNIESDRISTPPFYNVEPAVTQTTLFQDSSVSLSRESYLDEMLSQTRNLPKFSKLLEQGLPAEDFKVELKGYHGTSGGTINFSNGEKGYYHYSPKNVEIEIWKSNGTAQSKNFSWNTVAKKTMDSCRVHLFSNVENESAQQSIMNIDHSSPTLKDLVTAPDTISVVVISSDGAHIEQVHEQRSGIEEQIGCDLLGKAPYPNTDDTYYFFDLDWFNKELPATLLIDDGYICFGKVVIAKYLNDIPLEPTKEDVELWLEASESKQVFTNQQILEKARIYTKERRIDYSDYDLFTLADRLNPSNRLRALLIRANEIPLEILTESNTASFEVYVSPSFEYVALGDNTVAFVGTDKSLSLNGYLHNFPVYGDFLVCGIDGDDNLVDLTSEQVRKYSRLLETRETDLDQIPYNIGDTAVLDDGSEYIIDTVSPSKLILRHKHNMNLIKEFPKEDFLSQVSIPVGHDIEPKAEEAAMPTKKDPPKYNYQYDYDGAFKGSARERFSDNIVAIETLFKLEVENRAATPSEQAALSLYAGWGGLSEAFDSSNSSWSKEYAKLVKLLGDGEYSSARSSVNSSFYTPLPVIKFIYSSLEKFGFSGGNILDPAAGTGRFFGALPETLKDSKLYGVEIDSVSARISAALYPNAHIYQSGYENSQFSGNQFDVAVGNVPFGNYRLYDPQYNKHNFMIHDYFFAKSIDQIRVGGVIAYITSAGTMDKKSSAFREYLAERCDLVGAIRLPDNTFSTTGTTTTSDILFLQKRELLRNLTEERPLWADVQSVHSYEYAKNGIVEEQHVYQNQYFVSYPNMVLGTTEIVSTPFGYGITCKAHSGVALEDQLVAAGAELNATIPDYVHEEEVEDTLPAPPDVKNFTFVKVGEKIYYREHGLLLPQKLVGITLKRMEGMLEIRDKIDHLVYLQTTIGSESTLTELREELSSSYDNFVSKYGELNNPTNSRVFSKDIQCNLLLALESKDKKTGTFQKADIFYKRTVDPRKTAFTVESAADALYVSLNQCGHVNLRSMSIAYGKSCDEILSELGDMLYQNPSTWNGDPDSGWETREEYLSGNIREKIKIVENLDVEDSSNFSRNLSALSDNLPQWIEAGLIEVRLGAGWVDKKYFAQFMYETFNTPFWLKGDTNSGIRIAYNTRTAAWSIYNKTMESGVQVREVFGTSRANAYEILEDCLNLKDTKVNDRQDSGKYVLNTRETQLARAKQTLIKNAFKNWIFADTDRRNILVEEYNNRFNSYRPREYSGSHLSFPNLAMEFMPYEHQKSAAAHIVDSTVNTLLDHEVGAGKTATMVMGAYERIRMGISKRALFAVPNHIVKDFSNEIFRLYPTAKVMVVTQRDFERSKRQQFLNRIAFSDTEMIVIAHSQFEKIQMSPYHREEIMRQEIAEMTASVSLMKQEQGVRFSVKQIEKQRNDMEVRLKKLQNEIQKDMGNVTFEEIGVDLLLIDEADMFKNCYIFTKLQNIAGVGTAASQRAADMLMKCRYLNRSGGKIVFATGTVISNAVSELYVMQRYLQEDMLQKQGIFHFDEWVATYAETVTSLEMAPEGNGFRQRTRLAKYFNIPELMQLYRTVADVQTEDTLEIQTPSIAGGEPTIVLCPPSDDLLVWVKYGVERCRAIRDRKVEPEEDNMLKFTLEAKLAGLDMRLVDPNSPFDPHGKLAECSNNVLKHYRETDNEQGVQIVFCDISTPSRTRFNVYDDLKRLCIEKGMKAEEISFIHDAKTDNGKSELFSRCRSGETRLLIGSTEKCGAGTNIQDKLIAEHHLDCPYRPRDIKQREGRIKRQGNMYSEIYIYRYVTERSFDAYLWNIIATKQRFISQIRLGATGQRTFEDKDEALLSFETVQAVATGDPRIMEKISLDNEISRLQLLRSEYNNQRFRLQDKLSIDYPNRMQETTAEIESLKIDLKTVSENLTDEFYIELFGKSYSDRETAGKIIIAETANLDGENISELGEYKGLKVLLSGNKYSTTNYIYLKGKSRYQTEINMDNGLGTATRLDNLSKSLEDRLDRSNQNLTVLLSSIASAEAALASPFEYEGDLLDGIERQAQLNIELNLDKPEESVIEADFKESEPSNPENQDCIEEVEPVAETIDYGDEHDMEI